MKVNILEGNWIDVGDLKLYIHIRKIGELKMPSIQVGPGIYTKELLCGEIYVRS